MYDIDVEGFHFKNLSATHKSVYPLSRATSHTLSYGRLFRVLGMHQLVYLMSHVQTPELAQHNLCMLDMTHYNGSEKKERLYGRKMGWR